MEKVLFDYKTNKFDRKFYCCTDIHGQYQLWAQIRDFLGEDDILFFLGDAIDRGPDGLKIMKELFEDKRVIYLPGNHEDSFFDLIPYLIKQDNDSTHYELHSEEDFALWIYNGGYDTYQEWKSLSKEDKEYLYKKLKELIEEEPEHYIFQRQDGKMVLLSHAGTSIEKTQTELTRLGCGQKPYLWDRRHYKYPWPEDEKWKDWMIIHGHTPVHLLEKQVEKADPEVLIYDDGHKIDLDLASFSYNKIALYDLDTDEIKYFYQKTDLVP